MDVRITCVDQDVPDCHELHDRIQIFTCHTDSCRKNWRKDRCIAAGWVTEGVSAFDELSGSAPVSIRQQALRGLAKIALERNDTVAAKAQYERILGKALMGRGRPAEHWAHSEYAWLVFEDGDLQVRQKSPRMTPFSTMQWESVPLELCVYHVAHFGSFVDRMCDEVCTSSTCADPSCMPLGHFLGCTNQHRLLNFCNRCLMFGS